MLIMIVAAGLAAWVGAAGGVVVLCGSAKLGDEMLAEMTGDHRYLEGAATS
jgi:hypothetical protein